MKEIENDLHHILRLETGAEGIVINLEEEVYTIGRSQKNSLVIEDKAVSRYHATIIRVKNPETNKIEYWIYDGDNKGKKSTNGLIVNQKYCSSHLLEPKDIIFLGKKVQLSYHQFSSKTIKLLKALDSKNQNDRFQGARKKIDYKKTIVVESSI